MFKRIKQKIKQQNLGSIVFPIIKKRIGMKEKTNDISFWDDLIAYKNVKYPVPTFISLYKARKELGFTQIVLDNLVKDGFMRTNGEKPPMYALEDVQIMKKVRDVIRELEDKEVFKRTVIEGKTKYLIVDTSEKGMSIDTYKFQLLEKVFIDLFGDIYKKK